MPHGHCFFWRPEILWLHVASDAVIAAAYYSIPLALICLITKRKDIAFSWIFAMFGAFILSCGTTHILKIWTMWHGTYRLEGLVALVTALLSVSTAIVLWKIMPQLLALPSPSQLKKANDSLGQEIKERSRAESEVRKLNSELEDRVKSRTLELQRSNEELEQFAYVASHDLQEPLRMIASFSELLKIKYKSDMDQRGNEYIEEIMHGAVRMRNLIDNVLEFSKLGRREAPPAQVRLGDILKDVLADLKIPLEASRALVTHDPLPAVKVNPSLIKQVLQNLIGNALKYHRDNVPLRIHVSAALSDRTWTFSVRDNGIGIDPRYFDQIFLMFKRLHAEKDYPGSGMGLAICKKIIEQHRGSIWVESKPGEGTSFFFTLPAEEDKAALWENALTGR